MPLNGASRTLFHEYSLVLVWFVISPFLCSRIHCRIMKRGKPTHEILHQAVDDRHISLLMIQTRPGCRHQVEFSSTRKLISLQHWRVGARSPANSTVSTITRSLRPPRRQCIYIYMYNMDHIKSGTFFLQFSSTIAILSVADNV